MFVNKEYVSWSFRTYYNVISIERLHDGRQTLTDKQEAYVIGLRELHPASMCTVKSKKTSVNFEVFMSISNNKNKSTKMTAVRTYREKRKKLSELLAVKLLPVLALVIG